MSVAFQDAVRSSHTLAVEAVVTDAQGAQHPLQLLDGTVTLDQTAAVRGRCDVTLTDDGTLGLVPESPAAVLAPYGNEVRLSRGLVLPDGTRELVSLGVFRIMDVEVEDAPGELAIRVAGLDRASRLAEARFEQPYQVAAGTYYSTAIFNVLADAWPGIPAHFTATAYTTPALIAEEGADRWEFAQQMATAISMDLFFDGDGVCRLVPDAQGAPVAALAEGEDGVLLQAGRRWSREGTFNRVIATGENTGEAAPARGVATDDNPLSPTYYHGPFGRVPRFYTSPLLTTDAQAASAAQSILAKELGTTEQVTFGSLVLPHLEPGDTVQVTRQRAGIDELHVIDSLTVPLAAAGTMTGTTRARVVT